MKSPGLLCLAFLLLGLAGCETTDTTPPAPAAPAAPVAPGPSAPAKHSPGTVDQKPVAISREKPIVPFDARQAGITGNVVVEFTITTKGDVVDAVAVTATYPAFIAPALSCISRWKFSPGMKDGRPVPCRMRETITFDL